MCCEEQCAHARRRRVPGSSTHTAYAKLKQSQLLERGGSYGIDDALQNRSCPMN